MNFIQNLALSFRLPAYAAMFCGWIAGLAVVGVFGEGDVAHRAVTHISSGAFILLVVTGAAPHHAPQTNAKEDG
jgi:hypothetical protein